MLEIPWAAVAGAGAGWTLFGALAWTVMRGLTTGTILTRREATALEKRISYLEEENAELTRQNGLMLREALPVTNSVLTALRQAAEGDP